MNSSTRDISKLLAALKYEDIPQEAIDQAKKLTLHVLAASFGSLPVPQTVNMIRMAEKKGGSEEATVWGGKTAVGPDIRQLVHFQRLLQWQKLEEKAEKTIFCLLSPLMKDTRESQWLCSLQISMLIVDRVGA